MGPVARFSSPSGGPHRPLVHHRTPVVTKVFVEQHRHSKRTAKISSQRLPNASSRHPDGQDQDYAGPVTYVSTRGAPLLRSGERGTARRERRSVEAVGHDTATVPRSPLFIYSVPMRWGFHLEVRPRSSPLIGAFISGVSEA